MVGSYQLILEKLKVRSALTPLCYKNDHSYRNNINSPIPANAYLKMLKEGNH